MIFDLLLGKVLFGITMYFCCYLFGVVYVCLRLFRFVGLVYVCYGKFLWVDFYTGVHGECHLVSYLIYVWCL